MISKAALDLILAHEGCPRHPYWPGGQSGITIGIGYDLGYHRLAELNADWLDEGRITCQDLGTQHALIQAVGRRGAAALAHLPKVQGCEILEVDARVVFEDCTLPKYEAQTRKAFPGAETLHSDVYGALVSLVMNRGADMGTPDTPSWDRRREMREIRAHVETGDVAGIAGALRSMKRLWDGQGLSGLVRRREDEARLVESAR